jgi:NTE family protein
MTKRALVLGGGGVAGIAWEVGVLAGLADSGIDVASPDSVYGTSAGATAGALLRSGLPMAELLRRQADPAAQNEELKPPAVSMPEIMETWVRLQEEFPDPAERRRRVGELALAADTVPEHVRRSVVAARLPVHDWPRRHLAIVVVDARTGEPVVADKDSGIDLVDAVAASSAVPMIWPPASIGDARYIDGGVRSFANADLAAGHDRVLVLAPLADPSLSEQVGALSPSSRVHVIAADEASTEAMGVDPLDPATRTPSAEAGYAQGTASAPAVRDLWS